MPILDMNNLEISRGEQPRARHERTDGPICHLNMRDLVPLLIARAILYGQQSLREYPTVSLAHTNISMISPNLFSGHALHIAAQSASRRPIPLRALHSGYILGPLN